LASTVPYDIHFFSRGTISCRSFLSMVERDFCDRWIPYLANLCLEHELKGAWGFISRMKVCAIWMGIERHLIFLNGLKRCLVNVALMNRWIMRDEGSF
jgi:hypothetical protein